MTRFHRSIATLACLCAALGAAPSMAQAIDSSYVGHWEGTHAGEPASIDIEPDGTFEATGSEVSLGHPVRCDFSGLLVPSRAPGIMSAFGSEKCFHRNHPDRVLRSTGFRGRLTPSSDGTLSVRLETFEFGLFLVSTMSRTGSPLAAAPTPGQIASPQIPGTWSGTLPNGEAPNDATVSVSVTLDLERDGSFSGTITGGRLGGCAFKGSVTPDNAFENDEESFADFGTATLSGCADSRLDGDYVVPLGASPDTLGFSFIRPADGQLVFEIEDMTQGTVLGSNGRCTPHQRRPRC